MFDSYIVFCPNVLAPEWVDNKVQIGARLGVDGEEVFLPFNIYVHPKDWDLIGCRSYDAKVNKVLEGIRGVFLSIHRDFFQTGVHFTAAQIKAEMLRYKEPKKSDTEMLSEIHSALFSKTVVDDKDKPLSKRSKIEAKIKEKMAKRRLDILSNS